LRAPVLEELLLGHVSEHRNDVFRGDDGILKMVA
jgi:hypothetical protein